MADKQDILYRIKVMQAYVDGKEIQARRRNTARPEEWGHSGNPSFYWDIMEYRIKTREPRRLFTPLVNSQYFDESQRVYVYDTYEECDRQWPSYKPIEFIEVIPEDEKE